MNIHSLKPQKGPNRKLFSENRTIYKLEGANQLGPRLELTSSQLIQQRIKERGSKEHQQRIDAERALIRNGIKGWPSNEHGETWVDNLAITEEGDDDIDPDNFQIELDKMTFAEKVIYAQNTETFQAELAAEQARVQKTLEKSFLINAKKRAAKAAKEHIERNLRALTQKALGRLRRELEQQRRLSKGRMESNEDELTGVLSRRAILAFLRRAIVTGIRNKKPVSIIMFDVDNFKQINDKTNGQHQTGDQALQMLSRRVEGCIRKDGVDALGRIGGEEFIIVLTDTDVNGLETVAKRVKYKVSGSDEKVQAGVLNQVEDENQNGKEFHFEGEPKPIRITLCQGGITIECQNLDKRMSEEQLDALINEAMASLDDGMRYHKNRGRNNYRLRRLKQEPSGEFRADTVPPGQQQFPTAALLEDTETPAPQTPLIGPTRRISQANLRAVRNPQDRTTED